MTPRKALTCFLCGHEFEVSAHRARVITAAGERPRCRLCRQDLTPGVREMDWLKTLPPDVLEQVLASMSVLAA